MLSLTKIIRGNSQTLRTLSSLAIIPSIAATHNFTIMADTNRRTPAKRHPRGRGNRHMGTAGDAAHAPVLPPLRATTPPLMAPVPLDTMRFSDLAKENLIHPIMLQTITEDLKFDHMMPVQEKTLHLLLSKRIDCLAQAKTGTGKTIAFLLPAIQTMINKNRRPGSGISLLVISPTRELAMQIAKEATALLKRLPQFKISFAIGGTNKITEEKQILGGCDILIATPGRLYDHLSDQRIKNSFSNLDTLVLDEADRLLDMGFMNALKDIIKCLPDKERTQRQGMLFSATIAPHVEKVAHLVLSKDYQFISTIPVGEISTHERIPQHLVVVPTFSDVAAAMVGSIRSEATLEGTATFKAIIFAPTAALVDFYGTILEGIPGLPSVNVLHSRVSQGKRTSVTNAFREAKNGILVATDVVARGMDFPLVTNVFQVGVPADKESYIHRLGRTGRAGAEGRGTFIIAQDETFFSQWTLKEINFEKVEADMSAKAEVLHIASRIDNHAKPYQAWLGYYKNHTKAMKWDNARLVEEGNKFAHNGLGSPEIPGLQKSIVGKMGLKGVKGLNVIPDAPRAHRGGGGGGEGRSAGSGGRGGRGGGSGVGRAGGRTGGFN
ncbi:DEAD/DEAH box helicase [Calycina marina]|uniref:ATP-dependent RNA helicase n=1 Tax=Calycina marina TaxID=1763456 RepID=A0A9P7YUH5_9HELO|nr:DEAD/DEAH box helicase [Calycina marina]